MKEYYDKEYKNIFDPEFEDADDSLKEAISKTLGFAVFKLDKAVVEIRNASGIDKLFNWMGKIIRGILN